MKTKMTLYIVDDDPAIIRALRQLAEVMGFGAEGYESAEAFLEGFEPNRPGCLILDMSLPGMNGLELQAELKNRSLALPVIFITGHGAEHIRTHAMSGAIVSISIPKVSSLAFMACSLVIGVFTLVVMTHFAAFRKSIKRIPAPWTRNCRNTFRPLRITKA